MSIVVALAAVAGLAAGVALGVLYAASRARGRSIDPSTRHDPRPDAESATARLAPLALTVLDHGVAVVDRDERVVLVNPAARRLGIHEGDALGSPDLVALVRRALEGLPGDAGDVRAAVDLPTGRGGREPLALSVTAVPLTPDDTVGSPGRVAAVCLLLSDVSEQRRLEAVRRDFVANVSHELKTPVGALTLLAEAIQDAADDPQAVHRFAGRIQHEGSRLAKLVAELMELSRVQGADPMPGSQEIEVAAILDEARTRTELAADQAAITVSVSTTPGLRVRGDDAQLATALANLIDNAIAYSGGGTRVGVAARSSSDAEGRPTVDIAVTDQGIGIAEADRERIFERFYRVDPARSRATGGTGLGLAIVKNIVNNHLGTVSVWSVSGSGSTFTIRLPRVHSDRPSSGPADEYRTDEGTSIEMSTGSPGGAVA